jgi:hypothetical protein
MSTQHTPGPWASNSADSFELGVYGSGYRIAKMTGGEINRDIANARLIAAAPDLLEALQGMLLGFSLTQNPDAYPSNAPCNKARAAIAKATGAA